MKILIVHRLLGRFGGAHKYLLGLIEVLRQNKWEVALAINECPDLVDLLETASDLGAKIVVSDFDNLPSERSSDELGYLIDELQPNLIDFQAASKCIRSAALGCRALRSSSAVKLFSMHLPIVTDHSNLHRNRRLIPWTEENKSLKERTEFLSLFDTGMSVSNYHAGVITKLLNLPSRFFTFLPNGVDIIRFSPKETRLESQDMPRIVACGGLTKQKRFDLLIDAGALLRDRGTSFEIVIAGEGADRPELENQIRSLNLGECVTLAGHIDDVASFLRSGDIYVLCSDTEGFPFATLEAMSCGLPSVVTNPGDLPLVVREGFEGRVVNCGDTLALSDSILELVENPELRRTMGESARRRVLEMYDSRVTWRDTLEFYEDLVREK
tara:strand:- start:7157 stop:8305 length:1149 start_codon:yes stop_codon:yes gene_type:complete